MSRITRTDVIRPHALSSESRRQLTDTLYAVHRQIFDGVDRESFAQYVVGSKAEHTWILVHKNAAGDAVGYFALHLFEKQLGGEPLAVFRAEAGLLRAYRGGNVNARFWMERVVRYVLRHPGRRVFYLGALVHPSSYSLFARHCGEVWPRHGQETPPALLSLMTSLASEFGLEQVDPARPLVRRVGWSTQEPDVESEYWKHCDKAEVRYFLASNPGYGQGHGLVTVVPLTLDNLLSMARSLLKRRLHQSLDKLTARMQRAWPGSLPRSVRDVQQLRRVPFLAHLDDTTLRGLAGHAERHVLPAGQPVFQAGNACDGLYLIERGAVYVLAPTGPGETLVDELGGGAIFGEGALLTGERRSASIRTATAAVLVHLPRRALLPLLEKDGPLREGLWKTFSERRFDDLVRGRDGYRHLGRKQRLDVFRHGEHRELAASQWHGLEAGTQLFVPSGTLEFEHDGLMMSQRGALLMEVRRPLRVKALETTRLVLLKPLAAGREHLLLPCQNYWPDRAAA
ncbi:cyclic nucleotide-binding domain-containing protein [Stigmatella erecta]|uniref:Cyclic nucleotide-binding domain-containing protein n=1 Tax=Stigmatella erecta TaxID=83460 RepID=A0A1I0F6U9_9BACT|nr:cyclic nucleotide-binding domain-containing protein [Stigmatella erecta]SET53860.1 Cyclic nucleotide-binding domain-containing protein [Stigmatella erecta]